MALIGMAIYSTEENGKDEYLEQTLQSLKNTVDFTKHRLQMSINAATDKTTNLLYKYSNIIEKVIWNKEGNIGTAEAINKVWQNRLPKENAVKMDDDVIIHHNDWLYLMEESISRDPHIGQIGLKRRDCTESPWNLDKFYRSELVMLPHEPGQKWITVERVSHVMGTCVMHSSALLDKVGYLYQPKLYGFDDAFMSLRSRLAGFDNVFLTAVDIEHIDRGDKQYQKWKEQHATECWQAYQDTVKEYTTGKRDIYYNPFIDEN